MAIILRCFCFAVLLLSIICSTGSYLTDKQTPRVYAITQNPVGLSLTLLYYSIGSSEA